MVGVAEEYSDGHALDSFVIDNENGDFGPSFMAQYVGTFCVRNEHETLVLSSGGYLKSENNLGLIYTSTHRFTNDPGREEKKVEKRG